MNITDKTGHLIAIKEIHDNDGLMIINKSSITIRMSADNISVQGRNTQGVRLINLSEGDEIAGVAKIASTPNESDDSNPIIETPPNAVGEETIETIIE